MKGVTFAKSGQEVMGRKAVARDEKCPRSEVRAAQQKAQNNVFQGRKRQ